MSLPRIQVGHVYERNNAWHLRFNVHEAGIRKQRSRKLCNKTADTPSKDAPAVLALAAQFIATINTANTTNDSQAGHNCPICGNRCRRTIEQKFASQ